MNCEIAGMYHIRTTFSAIDGGLLLKAQPRHINCIRISQNINDLKPPSSTRRSVNQQFAATDVSRIDPFGARCDFLGLGL